MEVRSTMQIGLFSSTPGSSTDLSFLPAVLESKEAQRQGITARWIWSVEELDSFRGDCLHLILSGRLPAAVGERLKAMKVPYVCSVSTILPEVFLRNWLITRVSRRAEIQEYCAVLRAAGRILVHSPAGAWMLERKLGFPKPTFALVTPPIDERVHQSDPDNFREKYDIGSFILSYAGDYSPYSNTYRLLQALEHINVASVVVGTTSDSEYSADCRRISRTNPRLRLLDEENRSSGILSSALSACDLFVDATAFGMWNSFVEDVISLGRRSVVSSSARLTPWFGESVEYVEPTSPELIRHGIVTALNKGPLASALVSSRHARSSSQFVEEMVTSYTVAMKSAGR